MSQRQPAVNLLREILPADEPRETSISAVFQGGSYRTTLPKELCDDAEVPVDKSTQLDAYAYDDAGLLVIDFGGEWSF